MKLIGFQVVNYRSVNDSGWIEVRDRTALVGRNESGKSNLLLALQSVNPPSGMQGLSDIKDFPRDRRMSEFSADLPVVRTKWHLTDEEQAQLGRVFPRAKDITEVLVTRLYKPVRVIEFLDLPTLTVPTTSVQTDLAKIRQSVNASLQAKDPATSAPVKQSLDTLGAILAQASTPVQWAAQTKTAVQAFRQACAAAALTLTELADAHVSAIERQAAAIASDDTVQTAAEKWVAERLPAMIYLADYPELQGHQQLEQLLQRQQNGQLTEADDNFLKLMKVAGLDALELRRLLSEDHEKRQQLTNRAGAIVTRKIRELWRDRQLTIRFNVDADYFDTLVSDPNAYYPVEVNLNERSRGFRWFFSFYITFAADTEGGPAEDAILLLDEPGLHLHALGQRDLLEHFKDDFQNQIVYTTHSPFMIPVDDLASVRTVNIDPERGTAVTNDPTGDENTLFPLQSALGYDLTQTLFVGDQTLVVEGVTDYWYLSAMSEHLADTGGRSLPDGLVITPAGGAAKVSYMVALLTSQRMRVLVLLDEEPTANRAAQELLGSGLIRGDGIIRITDRSVGS